MTIRTRGEDTRVEVMFILPLVMRGNWVGYFIAIVASTTFHSATNAIVHSDSQLFNDPGSLSLHSSGRTSRLNTRSCPTLLPSPSTLQIFIRIPDQSSLDRHIGWKDKYEDSHMKKYK